MDKKQILIDGFNQCLKTYRCGNFISMSDVEGLDYSDIEWSIDTDTFQFIAFTEFGLYYFDFDFDFDFDSNLNEFLSQLQEFLVNEVNANKHERD